MDNANVIIVHREFSVPSCSRGHKEQKMRCTSESEGACRFLCDLCLMRTFVLQLWLVELIDRAIGISGACKLAQKEISQFHSAAYSDCKEGCPGHEAMEQLEAVITSLKI